MDKYKTTYPKVSNISGLVQVSFQVAKLIVNLFTLGRNYSFFFESNTDLIYNPICCNSKKQLINTKIKYSSKPRLINQINRDKKNNFNKNIKIASLSSFQWNLFPKLNKKTKIIANWEKKKHFLSVDIIIKRLYSYDYSSLIELIDNNWNNMNNPNLLNYHNNSHDNAGNNINNSTIKQSLKEGLPNKKRNICFCNTGNVLVWENWKNNSLYH